nr:MAG TPA: hypothetical protein [Caudoviricetes sp.]
MALKGFFTLPRCRGRCHVKQTYRRKRNES